MALNFGFILETNKQIRDFLDATSIMAIISETGHVKFSSKMLSIMSTFPPPIPLFALQFLPSFFKDHYFCIQPHSADIDILLFHARIYDDGLEARSLTIYVDQEDRLELTLEGVDAHMRHILQLSPWNGTIGVSENFNLETFVSIDSELFRNIVLTLCYEHTNVIVTLRNSHIEFYQPNKIITLTPNEGHCIIGGVPANYVLQFPLRLMPRSFYTLAPPFKRVWIFRSDFTCRGVISAPIGLHTRFLVYTP